MSPGNEPEQRPPDDITEVVPVQDAIQARPPAPVLRPASAPLSAEDLIALNDEIAGMARAGLPLDQGLAALAHEMGYGRLQRVTAHLAEDLRAGLTLPEALERRGSEVPPFYAALVSAGIRTGRIGDVLSTLTVYARALADVRATILSALFYPAIIICLAAILFAIGCIYILPQFEAIFRDFGIRLPLLTQFVLFVGRHPFEILILPPVLVAICLLAARFWCNRTEEGRRSWARFIYAIPILGTLIRSARLSAFTDLLGIFVDHSVPLPEAFRLAGEACSDPLTASSARLVEEDLRQGVPLGEVMRNRQFTRELIVWMIGLGEKRGTLGTTLHQVAVVYRRQVEMRAAILRSVLPPFLVVVTAGVLVVFFVFGMILPMFRLLEGLSGG